MMDEDMKVTVAVLKEQVAAMQRDAEKREKLQDARHAEMMAELRRLEQTVTSAQEFGRGVKAAMAAGWAVLGGTVTFLAQSFLAGPPR